jgi:peptidyl-tRNA hydrolase
MNKLYVIGRADLDPGLLCAQLGHAAIAFALRHPALEGSWEGNLIMLQVPDRDALEALQSALEHEGVVGFREPDRHASGFLGDELTALAVMPTSDAARRALAPLQLAFAGQRLPRGPGLARARLRTNLAG